MLFHVLLSGHDRLGPIALLQVIEVDKDGPVVVVNSALELQVVDDESSVEEARELEEAL